MSLLISSGVSVSASTISSNLSNTTAGTEAAMDGTWLTSSFGSSSGSILDSVTLLLSSPSSATAEVDLYSSGTLSPGTLIGTLGSSTMSSAALSPITFTANGLILTGNSTYWIVLESTIGEVDWAWTEDNSGSGSGYQGTWGVSSDAGSTWYTYATYPVQFSASISDVAAPEPASSMLSIAGCFLLPVVIFYRRKTRA